MGTGRSREGLARFTNSPGKTPPLQDSGTDRHRSPEASSRVAKEQTTPVEPPSEVAIAGELSAGLSHELKRLQSECAKAFAEYQAEPSPVQRIALQKIYLGYVTAMRQLAKPASAAELEAKNFLAIADVEKTWARAMQEFRPHRRTNPQAPQREYRV